MRIQSRTLDQNLAPAGFWLRFFAYVLDGYVIGIATFFIVTALVAGAFGVISFADIDLQQLEPTIIANELKQYVPLLLLVALAPTLFFLLYSALFEASAMQGTPGKWLLGLVVTDGSDVRISFSQAFLRNVYKVTPLVIIVGSLFLAIGLALQMSAMVFLAPLLVIGGLIVGLLLMLVMYLRVAFSEQKQGLHDRWAYAYVQKKVLFSSTRRVGFSLLAIFLFFLGSFTTANDQEGDLFDQTFASTEGEGQHHTVDWNGLEKKISKNVEQSEQKREEAPAQPADSEDQADNEHPQENEMLREKSFDELFPSENQKRSIDILKRGSEIDKGGIKNATTRIVTEPPVTTQSLQGFFAVGKMQLKLKKIGAKLLQGNKSIQVNLYGARKGKALFNTPTVKVLLSYRTSVGNCKRRDLIGYVIKLRAAHFGIRLPGDKKYLTIKRSGSDVILHEEFNASCQRHESGGWVRLNTHGRDAMLVQGTRHQLEWDISLEKIL